MINAEQAKQLIIKAFEGLIFDEATHTYQINGISYISVTTSLKSFYNDFDEFAMAQFTADKYNRENPNKLPRTAMWYRHYWKLKRNEASAKGTRVHKYAELYPELTDPTCNQEKGVKEWFDNLDKDTYEILFMEKQMFCHKLKKAGTADLLLFNKKTGNIVIADWKTNNTSLLQVYDKKKLKKPFNKLYDNSLNKYKLQLSTYQAMIENNTTLKIEDRWIIWLKEGNWNQLDEGKNETKYIIEQINPSVETTYYKQYNVESYAKEINLYEEKFNKVVKKKFKKPSKIKSLFAKPVKIKKIPKLIKSKK